MTYLIISLIIVILLLVISFPFLVEFDIRFNILKLKGRVIIKFLKFVKLEFNIRIKNGYIYINHKNKLKKEKLTEQTISFQYLIKLLNQMYFREQFISVNLKSNFGYKFDAKDTAVATGYIDVISKSILAQFKNHKKSTHIFVSVEPKYNQDIFNFRLTTSVRISIFDILYSALIAGYYLRREYNEKRKFAKSKQKN
ncbi:MAG: hypothetical protein IKA36_01155 [Clostridia bacterium]|nr:hypothetical protein [Clostridia bacterium]